MSFVSFKSANWQKISWKCRCTKMRVSNFLERISLHCASSMYRKRSPTKVIFVMGLRSRSTINPLHILSLLSLSFILSASSLSLFHTKIELIFIDVCIRHDFTKIDYDLIKSYSKNIYSLFQDFLWLSLICRQWYILL